ncbi:hypothetical protein PISMIDRAFT_16899 [Pisolithus microcarpus 441]|uniref:Uncharacterized protein n=1 Tax=Pisolithus microcarpus 441 TaxID=765257 RepID=A0A0C9YED1_9AGAM|nr:hypothetical protein PISMIDRAFT_16899 [Pisolithus microcarpus 441]
MTPTVTVGVVISLNSSLSLARAKGTWDAPKDIAPSPVDIARYLARNRLSFQEADNLYSWGVSFLQDESDMLQEKGQQCHNGLTWGDYLQGTPKDCIADQHPLEYYLECAQELGLLDFRDIKPVPANVNSLSGVEVVRGMIAATNCDDDWDLDTPMASNVQQMDVNDSGLAPIILLFDFKLVHIPTTKHATPDGLSRRPKAEEDPEVDEDEYEDWVDECGAFAIELMNCCKPKSRLLHPPEIPLSEYYSPSSLPQDVAIFTASEIPPEPSETEILRSEKVRQRDKRLEVVREFLETKKPPDGLEEKELESLVQLAT